MACPQCQSDEISPAGLCLICGYQVNAKPTEQIPETETRQEPGHSGPIEVNYTEGEPASNKGEVPPWRQQLSQRLHEIRQKKEAMAAAQPERKTSPAPAPAAVSQLKTADTLILLQERLKKVPIRKPQVPVVPMPRQRKLEPLPDPATKATDPTTSKPTDAQEIKNLIDSAVLRQVPQSPAPSLAPVPVVARTPLAEPESEGKLILLSRTLSGLVDLIVIVLCTGACIIAADYFSGIIALDYISLLVFSVVFLMVFFLYSLFFLSASNQTIGMMITDLRVVGANERRPSIGQLIGRCSAYMFSLLCAGIGLILGLFDRDSLCFHDRVSGTHVIRI